MVAAQQARQSEQRRGHRGCGVSVVLFCLRDFEVEMVNESKSWNFFNPSTSKLILPLLSDLISDAAAAAQQGEEYVNIFYLDAAENNGVIYLFGKLPIQDGTGAGGVVKGEGASRFSCFVLFY